MYLICAGDLWVRACAERASIKRAQTARAPRAHSLAISGGCLLRSADQVSRARVVSDVMSHIYCSFVLLCIGRQQLIADTLESWKINSSVITC